MLIIRLSQATAHDVERVGRVAAAQGVLRHEVLLAADGYVLCDLDAPLEEAREQFADLPHVAEVMRLDTPYALASRRVRPGRTRIRVGPDLVVGSEEFVVMAGPCAVETVEQLRSAARAVRGSGARVLRGGAFKPRTSPFCFQGRGTEGLEILAKVGRENGLPVVSEVMDPRQIDVVVQATGIVQVGMRNSQNFSLLRELGRHTGRSPVLFKCGTGVNLVEFLCAADYILAGGNPNVILCLRGSLGTSGQQSRASLNIADIPALRQMTHLPIIVDPSHAAGRRDLVPAMAAAALVAGADGLLIEVHDDPDRALVDGAQSLTPGQFDRLMHRLRQISGAVGRAMFAEPEPRPRAGGHPLADLDLEAPAATEATDPNETDILGNAQA